MKIPGVVILAVSALSFTPARAQAEPDAGPTYAEQLFRDAVQLMREDKCPAAVGLFTQSQKLDPSPGTLANLATCYARIGRISAAWRTYQEAVRLTDGAEDPELKDRILEALDQLERHLVKVVLVLPQGTKPIAVRINGQDVDSSVPAHTNPGEIVVEAEAPGCKPWRQTVKALGTGATVLVRVPQLNPAAPTIPPVEATQPLPTVPLILGGAGAAAILLGTVFGVQAITTHNSANASCMAGHCTADGQELHNRAEANADLSTACFVAGGAAISGAFLFWLATPARPVGVRLTPTVGAQGARVVLEGDL